MEYLPRSHEETHSSSSTDLGSTHRQAQERTEHRQIHFSSQTDFRGPNVLSSQLPEPQMAHSEAEGYIAGHMELDPNNISSSSVREHTSGLSNLVEGRAHSVPSAASAPATISRSIDDGEQSASHGTLMLSEGGRSKYLGPTAGSEWLKDVRPSLC